MMAEIDKIYGTSNQWKQLHDFLFQKNTPFINNMYPRPSKGKGPIANFDCDQDMWLLENCPLEFVQKRLREQHKDFDDK
jgi:hypothetical protein